MKIALDVRVRNAAIAEAMQQHRCTQRGLADLIGVSYQLFNGFATLRVSPWTRGGDISAAGRKVAEFLGLTPDEAFPPQLYAHFEKNARRLVAVREARELPIFAARALAAASDPESEMIAAECSDAMTQALATLNPRERQLIEMRFGFHGMEPMTLMEAGRVLNIGPERARQIEAQAMRHLRHPSRSRKLRAFA